MCFMCDERANAFLSVCARTLEMHTSQPSPNTHCDCELRNAAVRSAFLGTRAFARACTSTKHPKHHVNHPYISIISDLHVMFFICVRCARAGRSSAFDTYANAFCAPFTNGRTDEYTYMYMHMHTHYSSACLCLQCSILYIGIYTDIKKTVYSNSRSWKWSHHRSRNETTKYDVVSVCAQVLRICVLLRQHAKNV